MSSALTVNDLSKTFETAAGPLPILENVNLSMSPGEALAVTGPSGSGKSTFLYIVGLLDEPTSGAITIHDEQPLTFSAAAQAKYRNQKIGFIFQDHHLLPQCTVIENVLLPSLAGRGNGRELKSRAEHLLERVGLSERLHHRPAQLSGGEKQRVAVCRSLVNQPILLLADEPTGNLDPKSAEGIGSLLLEVAREQQTMLICVTHSLELAGRFPKRFDLQNRQLVNVE